MAGTSATLEGVPIAIDGPVTWELSQGTKPVQQKFVFSNENAQKLAVLGKGLKPLTLEIKSPGFPTLTVKGLRIVATAPTRAPYLTAVVVADARVLWSREHVAAAYNIRRRTGDRYLVADVNVLAIIPPNPDVFYAKFSLQRKAGTPETLTPWDAKGTIEDVLIRVTVNSGGYSMSGFEAATALPVEGLTLDDAGPEALARALNYVPALAVYLDYDSVAQLTSRANGAELTQLVSPAVIGPDVIAQVDLADVRPSAVEIYFSVEQEIRFNFIQGATLPTGSNDPRVMFNVMPLPDPVLHNYKDSVTGQTKDVYQGTYVPIDQNLLDAWNADTKTPFSVNQGSVVMTLKPITFDLINRFFFFPGGYSSFDDGAFGGDPEPVWRRRFGALQQHYRQTYQLYHRWIDRVRQVDAVRAGVLDFVNGTRAPASIYQNYAAVPNMRRMARRSTDPGTRVAQNANIFPVTTYAYDSLPDLSGLHPVPTATLSVKDEDQGIIHFDFMPDAWGDFTQFMPCLVQSIFGTDKIASWDPATQADAAAGGFGTGRMKLQDSHAASTVLTVVPASPNDLGQFHKVVISPTDAAAALPRSVSSRIGECRGPVWKLRVGPGILTARFVWIDGFATQIEDSIFKGTQRNEFLLLNNKQVKDFAQAVAASLYSAFVNRPEGTHVTAIDPSRVPTGRIEKVVHELSTTGAALTLLNMPPDQRGIDAFALLPESIRRQILGLVNPRI